MLKCGLGMAWTFFSFQVWACLGPHTEIVSSGVFKNNKIDQFSDHVVIDGDRFSFVIPRAKNFEINLTSKDATDPLSLEYREDVQTWVQNPEGVPFSHVLKDPATGKQVATCTPLLNEEIEVLGQKVQANGVSCKALNSFRRIQFFDVSTDEASGSLIRSFDEKNKVEGSLVLRQPVKIKANTDLDEIPRPPVKLSETKHSIIDGCGGTLKPNVKANTPETLLDTSLLPDEKSTH